MVDNAAFPSHFIVLHILVMECPAQCLRFQSTFMRSMLCRRKAEGMPGPLYHFLLCVHPLAHLDWNIGVEPTLQQRNLQVFVRRMLVTLLPCSPWTFQ